MWPSPAPLTGSLLATLSVVFTAPQLSAKGSYVYVVKQDMTVDQRQVTLGQRQGDQVVIEEGVQPGERVVTNGQVGVTPGGKVRIETPPSNQATTGTK